MKLLFVHQNSGDFGGAETNIYLSAEALRERGHEVSLLYRQDTGRNVQTWENLFQPAFRLPFAGDVEFIEAVLDQVTPDLIYLHNFSDLDAVEALLNSGRPVVRMVHDHSLYCMRTYKYNYFTRRTCTRAASPFCVFPCLASVVRNREGVLPFKFASYSQKQREIRLNRRCQRVVTYSEYLKAELVRNGFEAEKIAICVPIRQRFEEEPTSSFSDRNLILFAGQMIRGKGVDALLRALARVRTPFEALLLGDGSHRRHCERLAHGLGLAQRVRFQGYVPPARLKEYYLEASVFVMSSLWPEPFGMAGPEAMRYGLPVVAFDAGGIHEWLRDGQNGYLVSWNDTVRFAERLDELLRDKSLARKLGRQARESIRRYESSRQINLLEELFRDTLRRSTGARASAAAFENSVLL
jgi:glycosyltransferase involved in cell wall biosynthesis